MLYGYTKNPLTTIVAAALNKAELEAWFATVGNDLHTSKTETDMMQHLTDAEFQPYQVSVYIFTHASEEQQNEFIEKHSLLIGTPARAVDRQIDMVNYDAPDAYDINDERTIEHLFGLDKEDRYDRRSDEVKEQDASHRQEIKKIMDERRKDGQVSDESFSPVKSEGVYVTDIRTTVNADGSVSIDNVLASKVEGNEVYDEPVYGESSLNQPEKFENNAKLTIKADDRVIEQEVRWSNKAIFGAEDIAAELSEKGVFHIDPSTTKRLYEMNVVLNDGSLASDVHYSDMFNELYATTPNKPK